MPKHGTKKDPHGLKEARKARKKKFRMSEGGKMKA